MQLSDLVKFSEFFYQINERPDLYRRWLGVAPDLLVATINEFSAALKTALQTQVAATSLATELERLALYLKLSELQKCFLSVFAISVPKSNENFQTVLASLPRDLREITIAAIQAPNEVDFREILKPLEKDHLPQKKTAVITAIGALYKLYEIDFKEVLKSKFPEAETAILAAIKALNIQEGTLQVLQSHFLEYLHNHEEYEARLTKARRDFSAQKQTQVTRRASQFRELFFGPRSPIVDSPRPLQQSKPATADQADAVPSQAQASPPPQEVTLSQRKPDPVAQIKQQEKREQAVLRASTPLLLDGQDTSHPPLQLIPVRTPDRSSDQRVEGTHHQLVRPIPYRPQTSRETEADLNSQVEAPSAPPDDPSVLPQLRRSRSASLPPGKGQGLFAPSRADSPLPPLPKLPSAPAKLQTQGDRVVAAPTFQPRPPAGKPSLAAHAAQLRRAASFSGSKDSGKGGDVVALRPSEAMRRPGWNPY